jgi:multiple sugar transport system permease protein/sn-glycerol 3-phosphate transport system permease protein
MDHLLTTVSSEKGPPPGAGGVGPEAPTARPGATHTSSRFRRGLLAWLRAFPFLAPSLFGVSVFLLLPVVLIFVLSLLQWNLLSPPKFVGFQNFLTIFQQDGAGHSLLVTAYYVVLAIPLQTVLSLGMAVMLNRKLPGMGVYRVLFVVPFMATPVALAVVWNWIFDPKFGFANLVLGYLGIPAQNWLGSYRLAMPVLAAVQIWQWVGYNMLFFLAGLQGIPPELLESAAIDGAGHWQRFRRVTLPLLRPTTLFVLVTTIIGSFQVFDTVYVLTDGGPGTSTQVLNLSIYQTAFTDFRIGEASAMSVVLFIVVLIFTFIQFAYFRRRTVYEYV